MYQPFLTEKANFLAEHGHLPEPDRLRLWTRYNRYLDEQVLDGQANIPGNWLDISPGFGRRLSVPGDHSPHPMDCRLSQSAPPSFCMPRTDFFETGTVSPQELSLAAGNQTQDDILVPAYETGSPTDQFLNKDSAQTTILMEEDSPSPFDPAITGFFGPLSPDCQSTALDPTSQPPIYDYTVDPPGPEDGLVDMLWSENSTRTATSCETTLGSSLTSDVSFPDSAHSSYSNTGGIVSPSFGPDFPCFDNFHNTEFISDESVSYVTSSLQRTPSIFVSAPSINEVDESPFEYPCFDISAGDNIRLSSPYFTTPSITIHPPTEQESLVKCDSTPFKNTSPVNGESRINRTSPQELHSGLRPLASKNSQRPVVDETKPATVHEPPPGKRKVSAFRSTYSRPKHPKKLCHLCNVYPEGFRGEHELRRHMDRAHMPVRKMFICVDKSSDGKFLENCKKCKTKKKYGAYYNAAAHLRRTHFNKRERGRGRGKAMEKRAGAGGGDYPSMEYLKNWIVEIEDINPHADSMEPSDNSSEDEITPEPVLNTDYFEAYSSFDSEEAINSCSSYAMPPENRGSASFVQSEGHSYSHSASITSVNTPHNTHLRFATPTQSHLHLDPYFSPSNITSCPNSLATMFFPGMQHQR